MKVVTIWNTYGPYHIARVEALSKIFGDGKLTCFSHCRKQDDYTFFDLQPTNHVVLVDKGSIELRFIESFKAALHALWKYRPDVVLTCGYERPETLASLIWARLQRKTVFLMLDNQLDDCPRNIFVEHIKKIYLRFFDGFIYGGHTHKNYLRHLGVPKTMEVNGYNCVDNDSIWARVLAVRQGTQRLFPSNDYFLCVARLIKKKNLPRLIQAYASYFRGIKLGKKPWSLVICGDGPERDELQDLVNQCGMADNVVFVGLVSDFNNMLNYYAFARALVLASHENEQWGLVVNEAMASGLPVVVSEQCGCSSSLVKNFENGFSFDGTSVKALTEHLLWLHGHEADLAVMGKRSREIVSEYSPANFATKVFGLYQSRHRG
jgi:1,2-diacylglycerol 3-alpha-glucosyltransferase